MGIKTEPAFRMAEALDLAIANGDTSGRDSLLAAITTVDAGAAAHSYVDVKKPKAPEITLTDTSSDRALTVDEVFDFAVRNGRPNVVEYFLNQRMVNPNTEVWYTRPSCNGSAYNAPSVPGRPDREPAIVAAVRFMIVNERAKDKVEAGLMVYAALLHHDALNDDSITAQIAGIQNFNATAYDRWHKEAMDKTRV